MLEFAGLRVLQEQSLQHLLEAADGLLVEGLRHKRACEAKATMEGGAVPGRQTRQSVRPDTRPPVPWRAPQGRMAASCNPLFPTRERTPPSLSGPCHLFSRDQDFFVSEIAP